MKKLACFDLDGTLFDTNLVNYHAYKKALEEFGFTLDKEYYISKCNGRHYTEFLPIITNNAKREVMEKIHIRKKELYPEFLDKAVVNEGLFQIIDGLRKNGCKTVVVTTASRQNTIDILSYYKKMEYFNDLITAEDYTNKKPAPDSFLEAMRRFNVEANETMIFEDSEVGIMAARNSGASVFAINNF